MTLPGMSPLGFFGGAPGGPISLSLTASPSRAGAAATAVTFSTQAIGTAASDRIVYVTVGWRSSGSLTSATIGGVAATIQVQIRDATPSPDTVSAIISAPVPSGTTGDVVLNFSASSQPSIRVYRVVGGSGTVASTQSHQTTGADEASNSYTVNVDAGGAVIVTCVNTYQSNTLTFVGVTEDADVNDSAYRFGSGSAAFSTNQTGLAVTITSTSTAPWASCLVVLK